jgi:hypothetical protein
MSGLLLKKAPGAFKASKVRFFRLEGDRIEYFPVEGGKCLGTIDLAPSSTVSTLGPTRVLVLARGGRTFDLEAQTGALRDAWAQAIVDVVAGLQEAGPARAPVASSPDKGTKGSGSGQSPQGPSPSGVPGRRASVAAAPAPVVLEGAVKKRGGSWRSLKARHFVLHGNRLEYLVAAGGKKQGEVLLGPSSSVSAQGAKGFNVQSYPGARVFECETDTGAQRDKWIAAITATIEATRGPGPVARTCVVCLLMWGVCARG